MFITDLSAISPQLTYNENFLLGDKKSYESTVFNAIEPDYTELIPRNLLRRMGKAVRIGIGTGTPLINKNSELDGIIIGTANGGLEDCIRFLNQIIEYNEGTLTPTNFVQSTPNAIAGQLALIGKNRGYNITYTNGGTSFENAILDGILLFNEGNNKKLLIGGIEEISEYNYNIDSLSNKFKKERIKDSKLLESNTPGTICGEGAALFVVENESNNYYAQIKDVAQITYPSIEDLRECLTEMLERNNLKSTDIDSIMLGYNGDINHNHWYEYIENKIFKKSNSFTFKNLIGDYRTCSAFATWLSSHIINGEKKILKHISRRINNKNTPKNILIYNHFDTVRHGFILLSK
tara:strand:+ start:50637 stop:51683 length:1047 start_codon:yes stop_codon:yes gene_type:complete